MRSEQPFLLRNRLTNPDMGEMEYKMVIAVRKDLRLSAGKMAAQVAHAAVNCALISRRRDPDSFQAWYDEGQKKVVVKVADLAELHQVRMAADAAGLTTSLITDAGHTELPPAP